MTDMVAYIITHRMRDSHFAPYMDLCHPCMIQYDYIGKLETHDRDARHIIQEKLSGMGIGQLSLKQYFKKGNDHGRHTVNLEEYNRFKMEKINLLLRNYMLDMRMFGYDVKYRKKSIWGLCGY